APRDAAPTNKVDLLVLVDDSPGSSQHTLVANMPAFFTLLGGRDLHVAVITSSMGAGAFTASVPYCTPPDNPNFVFRQRAATDSVCSTARITGPEHFIVDGPIKNYQGNVSDVFRCIAQVGSSGCGFEHQLAAIRAALGDVDLPPPSGNAGFLRDDAKLAILILTDEDDCSAPPDSLLFDPNDSSLGPLASFRCTRAGILCDGQPPPTTAAGPLANCASNDALYPTDRLHSLYPTQLFINDFLRLKPDVVVFAIAAPPQPFSVTVIPMFGEPVLQHSCSSGNGTFGDPGVRIKQ